MQSKHWVFTVNNYTDDDRAKLEQLWNGGTLVYLVYGREVGESGTPHYQGYVVFKEIKRFSQVRVVLPTGCHIERKRGTPFEAANYCKKDGDFTEYGTPPKGGGTSSAFKRFVNFVKDYYTENQCKPSERAIAQAFPDLFVRYGKRLDQLAEHSIPPIDILGADAEMRPWQQALYDALIEPPPDDRGILFYVDQDGGKGKTWFQKLMVSRFPDKVQILSIGKRDDIAHAIDETKEIFLFNIPRGGMEFLQYPTLEQLKDRLVFSPKYNSKTKVLNTNPHIVVFCNEAPDITKMTEDRFLYGEF